MCGLLGFAGNPKAMADRAMAKAVLAKIKMLGLYNIERGKHSCGLYIDNTVFKGVNDDKLFSDFIQNNEIPTPFESGNFIVIGHTRMATHGVHSYANAHPFLVEDELVLAHNGVIRNIWSLCNRYKVNHTNIQVDSLGLAHLINKEGFKILNEYEGFAALLMYKASEPNSLYIYRGESRLTKDGELKEERPLYYMQTEEGIYVSSLHKSLRAISDSSTDTIKLVEGNIVHKITNGRMTKSKFPVNRDTINVGASTVTHGGSPNANFPKPTGATHNTGTTTTPGGTNSSIGTSYKPDFDDKLVPLIWYETLPSRALKGLDGGNPIVFWHMGRYWHAKNEEINLLHGKYAISRKGRILTSGNQSSRDQWYYEGIPMKNQKAFDTAKSDPDVQNPDYNFACNISKYSTIPVCNTKADISTRCKNASSFVKKRWYRDGSMISAEGFTPKFSERHYVYKDGLLKEIQIQKGFTKEKVIDLEALNLEINKQPEKSLAPVVLMPGVIANDPKQSEIPFKNDDVEKFDVLNFYRTFETVEEALNTFTKQQKAALSYYVADIMSTEMSMTPDSINDDNVETQVRMCLTMCVENGVTLMDMWDENNYPDVYHYMLVAKENPGGEYKDEKTKEDEYPFVGDSCDCPIVAKTVEIDETIEKHEKPQGFHEDAYVPADEEIIDHALDGVTENEELEYAFKDIVDYACDVRDCADELTAHNTEFADDVANAVYKNIDPLLHKLKEVCETHKQEDFLKHLQTRMKESLYKSSVL